MKWSGAPLKPSSTATALLDGALAARRPGPYQIQAAIAALHDAAATPALADWPQISALYGSLLRFLPTPVVELNAAVALAMAHGPEHGERAFIERRLRELSPR